MSLNINKLAIWLLGFCCCFNQIIGVRITSLDVPKYAWDTETFNCRYDLEGDTLYGVKWYKDGEEFYRCLGDGTIQEFPLKDIKIYYPGTSQLGSCYFELTVLSNRSGGEYACEVSLDWPTFKTVTQSARVRIKEPTRTGPVKAPSRDYSIEENQASSSTTASDGASSKTIYLVTYFSIFCLYFIM